jgi:putative membrane protein
MSLSLLSQSAQKDWAAAHELGFDWIGTLGMVGALLFALLFLTILLRALLTAGRYRSADALSEADRNELADEIARAEGGTVGEIVVVVLDRSDRHPGAEWAAGALTLLGGSALLAGWLPWGHPTWFLLAQVALGAAGFLCARALPGFKRAFVSEARATEVANEQALQEFYTHGLHRTQAATGVLLFVSLLERRVVVLGDHGIDAMLDASHWEATDQAVLAGVRSASLKSGLADGIRRAAEVLAEHFPRSEDDRDEVPNHVIVRPE